MFGVYVLSAHMLVFGAPPKEAKEAAGEKKPTVAVVPFVTASSQEYAPIGWGAALSISAQLLDAGANVVSLSELSQLMRRRDLTAESIKVGAPAVELARALGADFIIVGSYQARWPDLQMALKILDGKDGSARADVWELGKLEESLAAIDRMSARAFAAVGWAKVKPAAAGTTNVYAWREASLAAELLALQPFGARPRTLLPSGALRKARLHCEQAARLDPKWSYAHACFALALALHAVAAHDVKEAALALDEAKLAGPHPLAGFASYLARLEKGEEKEALAALEAAAGRAPGMIALQVTLAEHHQIRGNHAEAKKVLDRLLARAPDSPLAMVKLGKSLVALGDGEKGIAATNAAVERSGGDAQILVELGSRFIDLSRLDEAEKTLKRAMEQDKRDGRAYLRLGYVYLLQKKPADAIQVLERSIAESDLEDEWRARAFAHFDLARAHGQTGAVDKAFAELELAIQNGFLDRSKVEKEADFAALGKDPRWPGVLERMKN